MFSTLENAFSQLIVIQTGYRICTCAVHVYVLRDSLCALAFAMSSQLNVKFNILAASDWDRPLAAGRIKTLAAILFWTKTSVLFIILCKGAFALPSNTNAGKGGVSSSSCRSFGIRKKWIAFYCRPLAFFGGTKPRAAIHFLRTKSGILNANHYAV